MRRNVPLCACVSAVCSVMFASCASGAIDGATVVARNAPTRGVYPLVLSVRPAGSRRFIVDVRKSGVRAGSTVSLTFVEQSSYFDNVGHVPKFANGHVGTKLPLQETNTSSGPSYEASARFTRGSSEIHLPVLVRPARTRGVLMQCLIVGASVGSANAEAAPSTSQSVCERGSGGVGGRDLPVQMSVDGPSETRVGRLATYVVTVKALSSEPLDGVVIYVGQPDPSTGRPHPVRTDWPRGPRRTETVRLHVLRPGQTATFHVWARASGPLHAADGQLVDETNFAVNATRGRNPRTIITAVLRSPLKK